MQIPPPPTGSGKASSATAPLSDTTSVSKSLGADTSISRAQNLSNIEELNLRPNTQYQAKVVQNSSNIPYTNQNPVIQIGDKFVAVESANALRAGQILTVQLANTPSGPALKVAPNTPTIEVSSAAISAQNKILTQGAQVLPSAITDTTSSQAVLNGIGKVLPQQADLQTVLNLLTAISGQNKLDSGRTDNANPQSSISSANPNQLSNISLRVVLDTLSSTIGQNGTFKSYASGSFSSEAIGSLQTNNPSTGSQAPSGNRVNVRDVQSLLDSFGRKTTSAFSDQATSLRNLSAQIDALNSLKSTFSARSGSTASSIEAVNSALGKVITEFTRQAISQSGQWFESSLRNDSNALQDLKNFFVRNNTGQTTNTLNPSIHKGNAQSTNNAPNTNQATLNGLELLSRLASQSQQSGNTSIHTESSLGTNGQDLKQVLIQTVTTLSKLNNHAANGAEEDNSTLVLPNNLIKTPLEFPHLKSLFTQEQNVSKANASLADQDLSIGQLLKLAASMLNRIQLNQLNNLFQNTANETNNMQSWFFELPLQHQNEGVHVFQIRIDQQKEQPTKDGKRTEHEKNKRSEWKINLAFDLPELGPISIQVNFWPMNENTNKDQHSSYENKQDSVKATVWCERTSTRELIEKEKGVFSENLARIGLNVEHIHCHLGSPPDGSPTVDKSLIDVKA